MKERKLVRLNTNANAEAYATYSNDYELERGQSRVTLVTHDEGCVRYPT